MSGTSSLTPGQTSFVDQWGGIAEQAGQATGIAPALILSQWANESGWGTNTDTTANYNPGALGPNGSDVFSSPQAFEQGYVSDIQQYFPGAVNAGQNLDAFVNGLFGGTQGSYIGTTDNAAENTYTDNIDQIAQEVTPALANSTSNSVGSVATSGTASGTGTSATPASTTTTSPTAIANGITGWLANIGPDILLILIAAGIIFIGVSRSDTGSAVINTVGSAGKTAAKAAFV